jgi:hypothetical protein
MKEKEITLSELFYMVDIWFDSDLSPVIKVLIETLLESISVK